MTNSLRFQVYIWSLPVLAQISWSKAESAVCPKFSESLCSHVQSKSNSDTIYVNFGLRHPYAPKPDSCQYIDLKAHPDRNCVDKTDSAYWARVKQENREVYASYSSMMMDVNHPSQTLPYHGDSAETFYGVIVTKANLYTIVQDTNLVGAELYYSTRPIEVVSPQIFSNSKNPNGNGLDCSVNGQIIPTAGRAKNFKLRIRR